MFRTFVPFAVAALGGLCASGIAAPPDTLKPGEEYKGELMVGAPSDGRCYYTEVPVELKAGQSVSLTVTVVGKGRQAFINLYDPAGKLLAQSKEGTKTATLLVEEVGATGKYKIRVSSANIGLFTLRVTASTDDELDIKALEERLKELKKETEAVEAKLKALKAKKKNDQ
jgi:hypothetical protein